MPGKKRKPTNMLKLSKKPSLKKSLVTAEAEKILKEKKKNDLKEVRERIKAAKKAEKTKAIGKTEKKTVNKTTTKTSTLKKPTAKKSPVKKTPSKTTKKKTTEKGPKDPMWKDLASVFKKLK